VLTILFLGQVPLERVEHEAEVAKQTNVLSGDRKGETETASGLEDPIFGPSLLCLELVVFQPLAEVCLTFQAANSFPPIFSPCLPHPFYHSDELNVPTLGQPAVSEV
jgi:hypothetical protein